MCQLREKRSCNKIGGEQQQTSSKRQHQTNQDSLCAGNCDEDRGLCYCAGLATPFQRPLPHFCAPWAHKETKLPDGRPAYPVTFANTPDYSSKSPDSWEMAKLMYDRPDKKKPQDAWRKDWSRLYAKPFEWLYGRVPGMLVSHKAPRSS